VGRGKANGAFWRIVDKFLSEARKGVLALLGMTEELIGRTGAVAEDTKHGSKDPPLPREHVAWWEKLGPFLPQGKQKSPPAWRRRARNDRLELPGKNGAAGEKVQV
jgi:hypothetical protein